VIKSSIVKQGNLKMYIQFQLKTLKETEYFGDLGIMRAFDLKEDVWVWTGFWDAIAWALSCQIPTVAATVWSQFGRV
jgi:hypothetical protein